MFVFAKDLTMTYILIFIAAAVHLNLRDDITACTSQSNQQMEHIRYWIWPSLTLKSHCFSVLFNSCFSLSPPTIDTREESQVPLLSEYSLKRRILPIFTFSDMNEWRNGARSTFWLFLLIRLKHYRISLHSWLLSHHSSAPEWIMHHSLSSSLPESAAQLLHPVLVCWFFTFTHSFTHCKYHLFLSLARLADTYMSQVLEFSLCPLSGVWAQKCTLAENVKVPIY